MLPNHSLPQRLAVGKDTIAFFARAPQQKLILFVHGFGGSATGTWDRMHELLPLRSEAVGWDIVFYGYPSIKARALNSANLLRQFITGFPALRAKHTGIPEAAPTKVLIAAHSLGALITRQAVLDAHNAGHGWTAATRLLLFGPAHRGASATELGRELLASGGSLGALAAVVFQLGAPVLRDLEPSSTFVAELQAGTTQALTKHPKPPLTADRVLFGEFDHVVQVLNFCADGASNTVPQHGHISVCKPIEGYHRPLDEVVSLL